MERLYCKAAGLLLLLIFCCVAASAQIPLPPGFERQKRLEFSKIKKPEGTFAQYLALEKAAFQQREAIKQGLAVAYTPRPSRTMCGNGDFESGTIDPAEWQGAWGSSVFSADGTVCACPACTFGGSNPCISIPGLTEQISSNSNITLLSSHHTVVAAGPDPGGTRGTAGLIQTVPPFPLGNQFALRLGSRYSPAGRTVNLLSRTFPLNAGSALVSFWYAAYLEDPVPGLNHCPQEKPAFTVRVLDQNGTELTGVVNLDGAGNNRLVADVTNTFSFQLDPLVVFPGQFVYKDWSCQQIDLSRYVGTGVTSVTVEFIVNGCTQADHIGYVYLDNFCVGCEGDLTNGTIVLNPGRSDTCGLPGNICVDYTVPDNGTVTGDATLTLEIYQNGALVTTYTSPTLTTNGIYCFNLPAIISGLNTGLGGFDFVVKGAFTVNSFTLPPKQIGSLPYGQTGMQNDDYDIECDKPKPPGLWCCEGENLVQNGSFEDGNTGFSTNLYTYQPSTTVDAVRPGEYGIVTGNEAGSICRRWQADAHNTCNSLAGEFLAVNGQTTQTSNLNNVIWEQQVNGLRRDSQYRFCAYFKNLPVCCFDVKPRVRVEITPGGTINWTTINTTGGRCDWQLLDLNFYATSTSVTIRIYLEETVAGDGNDLAIDDISLQQIPKRSFSLFTSISSLNATYAQVTASINSGSTGDDQLPGAGCKYLWLVGEWVNNTISNPIMWGDNGSPAFWGLTTNFTGGQTYTFYNRRSYVILLWVYDCDCVADGFTYNVVYTHGPSLRAGGQKFQVRSRAELNLPAAEELKIKNQLETLRNQQPR